MVFSSKGVLPRNVSLPHVDLDLPSKNVDDQIPHALMQFRTAKVVSPILFSARSLTLSLDAVNET